MEELLKILNDIRPDVDYETADDLVDGGHLDSLDIITLVVELNSAFNIAIGVEDIIPENFNSVGAMLSLINSLSK